MAATSTGNPPAILLISAADASAANTIISELLQDNKSEECDEGLVWILDNKYYKAKVLLKTILDNEGSLPRDVSDRVEAHIIYVNNAKGEDEIAMERRTRELPNCEVRVMMADDQDCEDGLSDAALRAGLEPVWRNAEAGEDLQRARDALHAHCWTGLSLHDRHDTTLSTDTMRLLSDTRTLLDHCPSQRSLLAQLALAHLHSLLDD